MGWYKFSQNNSGGSFIVTDTLCHNVWIEADSLSIAVDQAKDLGVYFDGVSKGFDCDCCGDRWYEPWEAQEFPVKWSETKSFETVEEYAQYLADRYGWTSPDARLYYKDGTVKEIYMEEKV